MINVKLIHRKKSCSSKNPCDIISFRNYKIREL